MNLEMWMPQHNLFFLDPSVAEMALCGFYALVTCLLLILSRRDFGDVLRSRRRVLVLVCFTVLPFFASRAVAIRFPSMTFPPLPNVPVSPTVPFAAPLVGVPAVVAGLFLGAGPALLVGGITGAFRACTVTGGIADPFHFAFFGFLVTALLRQRYRGRLERLARQPAAAALFASVVAGALLFFSAWARVTNSGLGGFDYALQFTRVRGACFLLEALFAGLAAQALFLAYPAARPVLVADRISPLTESLNRKLLIVVVPLILVTTFALLYAVTTVAMQGAREEAIKGLARDAHSAADEIPNFIYTGQGLLAEFVEDERLLTAGSVELQELLKSYVRIGAFFDQLMLFSPEGELVAMYPPAPTGDSSLTAQEMSLLERVLRDGAPQISPGHQSQRDEALLSFLMPADRASGLAAESGCLIGRTHLQANPAMARILANLQWSSGRGEGFVVDSRGRIVAHPDPGMVLSEWKMAQYHDCLSEAGPQGAVCDGRNPVRNTREMLFYLPAQGYSWSVVIRLPYEVVLDQARDVAVPLLMLQGVFGGGLVVVIAFVLGRATDPLKQLANAAERIAKGGLSEPVQVTGNDEVGRLGLTFERMRARLKGRMSDLSLLLEVSQAVSSTLELSTGLSFALEGALKATGADVARGVLVEGGKPVGRVISRGERLDDLDALEVALVARVAEEEGPIIIPDLTETERLSDSGDLATPIEAAMAFPVCTKDRMLAVLWIGYRTVHRFEKSKLDFLLMLANQIAVVVENARLFQEVEGERTRLAAILESVSDPVVVTDWEDRLLLVNSAAERAFGLRADKALGKAMEATDLDPEVVSSVKKASPGKGPLQELYLPNGRVLYPDVSAIESSRGESLGRVAVLHDITRFKELDDMKSEFLATVSHDLRAPLTFMRGYADRLAVVGELNDKQTVYVENILRGVQRIDDLVLDLLDLSRIEAGLGVEREPCHLGLIVAEAVSSLRARATEKDISLQVHTALDSPEKGGDALVSGDRALLRQAVINLLDNAVKYTPSGGRVAAGLSIEGLNGHSRATIRVSDTGIGIAPEEQVRLFEKFYRTKRGDRSGASGTGLGLAIVKSIVERHDGKVWAESELDRGSTFYISLPLMPEKERSCRAVR